MKWFKAIPAFCATLLVATVLAGCAGSSTKESTGGYIDDTVVTTKVKRRSLTIKTSSPLKSASRPLKAASS